MEEPGLTAEQAIGQIELHYLWAEKAGRMPGWIGDGPLDGFALSCPACGGVAEISHLRGTVVAECFGDCGPVSAIEVAPQISDEEAKKLAERRKRSSEPQARRTQIDPEEVKARTDLAQLIEEDGIDLKRKGADSYFGLCPFHEERTPSFHVKPEAGFYYCFGCHEKGDALAWVQERRGVSFPEALRILAEKAGMRFEP